MTYDPTNAELYSLMCKLYNKIENLEKKIDKLSDNREINIEQFRRKQGLVNPEDVYNNWVTFIKVNQEHYKNLFLLDGGILNVFKNIVGDHIKRYPTLPIYKYNNILYVYQNNEGQEPKWELFNETNLSLIVTEIWRNLIKFQLNNITTDTDNDDIKDQKRRIVMQMRDKLLNVKKTRMNIIKWLREII